MLLATTLVAVLPLAASLALCASGAISGWLSVALAVVTSLAASTAGSTYSRKRGGHGEVLFGELLLWGWIRTWCRERELANATRLLDLVNPEAAVGAPDQLTVDRRERLLRRLAGALEGQGIYLNGHSRRVARHATMIARRMGLSSEQVARVRAAAAVHDVGKLRTPKAVLNKRRRLTDQEFAVIKLHPIDGAEMVGALNDPELTRIVRHHHERLDGCGYPDGLRGEEIRLAHGSSLWPTRSTRSPRRGPTAMRRPIRGRSTSFAKKPARSSTPARSGHSWPTTRATGPWSYGRA
jgi:putative nucleotidyltransferase with HDIG domain